MPRTCLSWSVERPFWVVWLVCGLAAAGLDGLLYCLSPPYVVTIVLLLLWLHWRGRRLARTVSAGTLHMAGQVRWELKPALSTPARNLRLVRVWLAPAWVTLRFSASAGPDSTDNLLQGTIWK